MSDTDSFIEEVSEEVRRDRLYKLMRRWGWIPVVLIVLLVGGAAYNEWSKATVKKASQALGTNILAAVQLQEASDRATAYDSIETDGDNVALVALLEASDALEEQDLQRAIETLSRVAADASLTDAYRHMAELKLILLSGDELSVSARLSRLQAIAGPGAPYRLLAEEQMAIADIAAGNDSSAMQRLFAILDDGELTAGLRRRVSQLIVALGGDLAPV